MLVAGLLVALHVANNCPDEYYQFVGTTGNGSPIAVCRSIADNAELVDAMTISATTDDMCYPASESFPCCHLKNKPSGDQELFCYTAAEDLFGEHEHLSTGIPQCGSEIDEHVYNGYRDYFVNCFPPAPPATDEGLNEAETGVIVVVSVIAVAAVAGALAVCREST
jgi:hypothetical protein